MRQDGSARPTPTASAGAKDVGLVLDAVDHDVSGPRQARHVGGLITAWAQPYLPDPAPSPSVHPPGSVVVTDAGTGRYTQTITAGRHRLTADEPVSLGGADAGPNPYELLLAALRACTSMTVRMYADRKGLPLHRTTVRPRHDRFHAKDCAACEQQVECSAASAAKSTPKVPSAIRTADACSRSPTAAPPRHPQLGDHPRDRGGLTILPRQP